MATMKKCDRCGAYYQPHGAVNILGGEYEDDEMSYWKYDFRTFDFCPTCMAEFIYWFDLKDVGKLTLKDEEE